VSRDAIAHTSRWACPTPAPKFSSAPSVAFLRFNEGDADELVPLLYG
jgi:hypothetical protein